MTMTAAARREAIQRAARAYEEPGSRKEAIALPYKDGKGGPYRVISVPVAAVLFNPRSHRIKSQLESLPQRQLVEDDPFSDEAQDIIHALLAATHEFDELKANLGDYGQRDPGVVTHEGLLVNANRRLAALRDLGEDYIRAALLPSDADEAVIDRLELELQVQVDFKEEYTFTNDLIFVDELLALHGYTEEKAARALNWAASSDEKELKKGVGRIRQSIRLYNLVREIQRFGAGAIPLTYFDDWKQALTDLDSKYEVLKTSDPTAAERVKSARIVGILSGGAYRDLRKLNDDDIVDVLFERLNDQEILGQELELLTSARPERASSPEVNDADLLAGGEEPAFGAEPDLQGLVTLLAKSHDEKHVNLPSGRAVGREELLREVNEAIAETAEEVQASQRTNQNLTGPVRDLEEAFRRTRAAAAGYQQVHASQGFDRGKFKYLAKKLFNEVDSLQQRMAQHGSNG